jgi:outer membrane protein TolC
VTDLLEAQTNAFTAEQNAASTVYRFLIDLVDFQRAIAWFEDERSPEEQEALLQRIETAVEAP